MGPLTKSGPVATGPATAPDVAKPEPVSPAEGDTGAGRTAGIVVAGGVGLAGLAVGAITGGLALGKKSIIDEHCEDTRCDHEGKLAADSGKTLSIVSTVGFGVGIAGAATAIILWLVVPSGTGANQAKVTIPVGVMKLDAKGVVVGLKGVF